MKTKLARIGIGVSAFVGVLGLAAVPAQAHPAVRITVGVTHYQCSMQGNAGYQAGVWDDYWCYSRPAGYELWVHYTH